MIFTSRTVVSLVVLVGATAAIFLWRQKRGRSRAASLYDTVPLPAVSFLRLGDFDDLFALSGVPKKEWKLSGSSYNKNLSADSSHFKLVMALLVQLDGKLLADAVVSVYGVVNPQIATNFEGYRGVLQRRYTQDPHLFKKDDWMKADRSDLRSWVSHSFITLAQKYRWNTITETVPIIPVVHGTDCAIAWKILDTGFCALSSLDAGFYGRGIYFSSSAQYTLPYYSAKPNPCLILCLAIPGNIYPVVEDRMEVKSLLGTPIKAGYQSNYVLTTKDGNPCKQRMPTGSFYDELVLDQEAQVVPIAIIEFDPVKLAPFARNFQREIAV